MSSVGGLYVKNTKNGISNSIYVRNTEAINMRLYVRKQRSYNMFHIIFPPIFR